MMKKVDPRSVVIGFLLAIIGFMSIGATDSTFDNITVNEILLGDKSLEFKTSEGRILATLNITGLRLSEESDYTHIHPYGIIVSNTTYSYDAIMNSDGLRVTTQYDTLSLNSVTGITQEKHGLVSNLDFMSLSFEGPDGDTKLDLGLGLPGDGIVTPSISLKNKHQKEVVFIGESRENDGLIDLSDRYGDLQWQFKGKR